MQMARWFVAVCMMTLATANFLQDVLQANVGLEGGLETDLSASCCRICPSLYYSKFTNYFGNNWMQNPEYLRGAPKNKKVKPLKNKCCNVCAGDQKAQLAYPDMIDDLVSTLSGTLELGQPSSPKSIKAMRRPCCQFCRPEQCADPSMLRKLPVEKKRCQRCCFPCSLGWDTSHGKKGKSLAPTPFFTNKVGLGIGVLGEHLSFFFVHCTDARFTLNSHPCRARRESTGLQFSGIVQYLAQPF